MAQVDLGPTSSIENLTVDVQPKAEEVKQRHAGEVWLINVWHILLLSLFWGRPCQLRLGRNHYCRRVARPLDLTASQSMPVDNPDRVRRAQEKLKELSTRYNFGSSTTQVHN